VEPRKEEEEEDKTKRRSNCENTTIIHFGTTKILKPKKHTQPTNVIQMVLLCVCNSDGECLRTRRRVRLFKHDRDEVTGYCGDWIKNDKHSWWKQYVDTIFWFDNLKVTCHFGRQRHRWKANIRTDRRKNSFEDVNRKLD
jgi:hypothetical protein